MLYEPHPFEGPEGVIGGNCLRCWGSVTDPWHQGRPVPRMAAAKKESTMTPKQMNAVSKTLKLIRENPPKDESWNRPGERTLADMLQSWLREQL